MAHALLSPSAASRWLNCTPSARLEQQYPDKAGVAAAEGTLAHRYAELLISEKLGLPADLVPKERTQRFNKELAAVKADKLYQPEMDGYVEDYAVFVLERYAEAQARTSDALIFLEQKLDLTKWVPEGFGTSDVVIIADGMMEIIDYKHGKGVPVDATENRQMMLYALGATEKFGFLYNIDRVRMTIHQPRIDNYSLYEMDVADLLLWSETELAPKAQQAWDGEGEFVPGKHCQFCKAKATCRALADYHMELARHEFKKPDLLGDEEITEVLERASMFKNWLGAVEDYALEEAVKNGKKWPGYKVVEGRSVRKYTDEKAIVSKLTGEGLYMMDVVTTTDLLPISKLEKVITKADFGEYVAPYVVKPAGKPTLVPATDKRPELNTAEAAAADFACVDTDE